jgi:arginase
MTIGLIGAPSSVAGHWPGMEKAPAFLRLAGIPDRLREVGAHVVDHGDLPQLRWRPDPDHPHTQNIALVASYLNDVACRVSDAVRDGQLPLVIGGECAITLGAVAGFLRHYDDFGLMYLDGHLDLNTPLASASGILDSMVMAHLFGIDGTAPELRDIGPRSPMLDPASVVAFGHNEDDMNPIEIEHQRSIRMTTYPLSRLDGAVRALAQDALAVLEDRVARFALHFDVDVIRFTDFPIANVPNHHEGLTFDQAMESIEVFASSDKCVGVLITEINPDHASEALGVRLAERFAYALRHRVAVAESAHQP